MPETHAPPARDDARPAPAVGRRLFGAGLAGLAASLLPSVAGRVRAGTDDTTDDTTSGTSDDATGQTTQDTTGDTGPTQGSTPRGGEDDDEGNDNVTVVPTGPTPDETDAAPESSGAATTTTEPARRPTREDIGILGFVRQVETAIVRLYDTALSGDALDDTSRPVFAAIRESHESYGQAGGAMLGQDAPDQTELEIPRLAELDFGAASVNEVADAAFQAEVIALTTHLDVIGRLQATDGGRLLASIAVMEARHCVVLSELAGRTGLAAFEIPRVEPLQMAEG